MRLLFEHLMASNAGIGGTLNYWFDTGGASVGAKSVHLTRAAKIGSQCVCLKSTG
jgi:hypothetical protein